MLIEKGVTFKHPTPKDDAEERPRKRARSEKPDDTNAKTKESAGPQPQVQAFGAVDREAEIQLLAWAGTADAKQVRRTLLMIKVPTL